MATRKNSKSTFTENKVSVNELKDAISSISQKLEEPTPSCKDQKIDQPAPMTQENTNDLVQGLATFVAALLVFISGIVSIFYCPFTFGVITLVTMVTCSGLMIKSNKKLMDTIKINIKVE